MSEPFSCHCPERKRPVHERRWRIWQYKCNHSAFNGYHYTPSQYSQVHCLACGATGRTKANYVNQLVMDYDYRMYDDGPRYYLDGSEDVEYNRSRGVGGLVSGDTVSG